MQVQMGLYPNPLDPHALIKNIIPHITRIKIEDEKCAS